MPLDYLQMTALLAAVFFALGLGCLLGARIAIRTAMRHRGNELQAVVRQADRQTAVRVAGLQKDFKRSASDVQNLLQTLRSGNSLGSEGVGVSLPSLGRRHSTQYRGYLAAVLFAKDEGSHLREWLCFHRIMGVEHIYLYDHGCSDAARSVADEFSKSHYLTRIPWFSFVDCVNPQTQAYAHAICNFGQNWRWLAFIDADEFLFPAEGNSVPAVLSKYEDVPAIAVYWRMFGFSGHQAPPAGLVIENFTTRAPFPPEGETRSLLDFKSIVNPSRILGISTAHRFITDVSSGGALSTNAQTRLMSSSQFGYLCSSELRLNHYYTKSVSEFEYKLSRKDEIVGFWLNPSRQREIALERARLLEMRNIQDEAICRFLPDLRSALEATLPERGSKPQT